MFDPTMLDVMPNLANGNEVPVEMNAQGQLQSQEWNGLPTSEPKTAWSRASQTPRTLSGNDTVPPGFNR